MSSRTLERMARAALPPSLARLAKRGVVYPRSLLQRRAARAGFRQYGELYPNPTLFIAGLPKSGTTWLERMVASYPGFQQVLIPDVATHELDSGGSHDYELPEDTFERFHQMLVLTKMHVHGSEHNAALLRRAAIPYVVLYRDLRDVAVSYYYYVRRTPWHPEYPYYHASGVEEGLATFARRTLPAYAAWVRSWRQNRDPDQSLMLTYEALLDDPVAAMTRVARLFGLDDRAETVKAIVDRHSFKRLSGGREMGVAHSGSFFRKGTTGDWRNHFTLELRDLYSEEIGDFLIDFEYEPDRYWE